MDPDQPDAIGAGAVDPHALVQHLMQQQQQQQAQIQHLLAQQQQPAQPHAGPGIDFNALASLLQQQQAAAQQQQLQATAQLLSLQALGQLPTFSGKGASTGLAALEWAKHAERFFAAREAALGITAAQGDTTRVTLAANALQEEAQRWYDGIPLASRPTTWTDFRRLLEGRYSSVPAVRVRLEQLRGFVDAARRLRDKVTLEGLQAYTSRFQQLAGEIPDTHLTEHGRLELLARGLSARLAEVVLTEDAKPQPLALHEIVQRILAKAAFKEYAGGMSSASGFPSSARNDAMEVDAISLCAVQFGITREEAARYVEPGEGWAPHDTDARSSAPAKSPASSSSEGIEERLLAAFEARFKALASSSGNSSSGSQGKPQSSRRYVPSGVKDQIPEAMIEARKAAGLCVKCGVVKYEGGGRGHNAKTCKAGFDKTTSVAEGKKKAGF